MAYPSISTAISAQRAASIVKAYIKTGSEKYQNIGFIRNGELKVTPYSTVDTRQRNMATDAYTFEAKFEMLQTKLEELELIDSIVNGASDWLFKLTDAATVTTSAAYEGWVAVTDTQVGTKARYVCDGNPNNTQFVEIMVKGTLVKTALDAALKATLQTSDFHLSSTASETFSDNASAAGGTIFGYYLSTTADDNTGVLANKRAAGFSTVALDDDLSSSAVTLGRVRNGRMVFDWVAEEDSLGRFNVYAIDVDIEYEYMVTDAATLLLLDSMNQTNTKVTITLLDGKVFTLSSKLGVNTSFENVGDFDKFRVMRFSHKGRILTSEFDGIVA